MDQEKIKFSPRRQILLAMGCFIAAIFLWVCQMRLEDRELAARIAPDILRFHVIANSNSREDQALKLKVKSFLLEKIYQGLEGQDEFSEGGGGKPDSGKTALIDYLARNREDLEREAEEFIRDMGLAYPVSLDVVECEFPEKYYGDLRLPAGIYETAQVRIGEGHGHNWWCILYPKVCITKDALAAVPESSRKELESLLSEEDFKALQAERPKISIGFRLWDMVFPNRNREEKRPDSGFTADDSVRRLGGFAADDSVRRLGGYAADDSAEVLGGLTADYSASSPKPFTPQ